MGKSVRELGVDDFVSAGLSVADANELNAVLRDVLSSKSLLPSTADIDPADIWRRLVSRRVLKPSYPHPLHQLLYYSLYYHSSSSHSASPLSCPPLYWFPSL